MRYILLLSALWAGPGLAEIVPLQFGPQARVTVPVADGVEASLARDGDWLILFGPGDRERRFEAPLFQPEIDAQAGFAGDFNGDGLGDLMLRTGIGYGGVNLFYAVLIWRGGEGWVHAADIGNPDFAAGRTGFTTAVRSGPFWYRERWDIGPDGLPYRQAQHTITFGGFELRETFSPDGTEIGRMVVAESVGLYDEMVPLTAPVGASGAPAQSPDPDGVAIALWLEPGTQVTLRDWDQASMLVEVEIAAGMRLWVDPEALHLD